MLLGTARTSPPTSACRGSRRPRICWRVKGTGMTTWVWDSGRVTCQGQRSLPTRRILSSEPLLHLRSRGRADSRLHPHFTHRESPGFVAVFLNLFNDTDQPHPSSETPPLDHRVDDRQWRTSHLSSFLGHIALERFHDKHKKGDYVRAVVNGRHKVMGGCEDGVGRSCQWKTFKVWVEERGKRWSDWESVCRVDHSTR